MGGEKLTIKLNSAQLELDLGLSLAIVATFIYASSQGSAHTPLRPKDQFLKITQRGPGGVRQIFLFYHNFHFY